MPPDDAFPSNDSTGTPVAGIRSEVFERTWELIWMTKDDIDTFEARIGDKILFQNIAILFLSASIPLGIEKFMDYRGSDSPTDLSIVVVCVAAAVIGAFFAYLSIGKRSKVETFKDRLFKEERRLSSTFSMVDASQSASPNVRTVQ